MSQVEHLTICAWIAAAVEPTLVGQRLLTDREHRAIESATGRPLASAPTGSRPDGRIQLHRPDLVLVSVGEEAEIVAVEVELTLKTRKRLERILRGYARNRRLVRVRYYAPPPIGEASGARLIDRVRRISWTSVHSHASAAVRSSPVRHAPGEHHERRRGAA